MESLACRSRGSVRIATVRAAFWIPLAVCAAAAFTANPTGVVAGLSGVVGHATAFAYLAGALFAAHYRSGATVAVVLWMLAFGVSIEVGQTFVDGRSGELLDVAIDATGIAVGCLVYRIWRALRRVTAAGSWDGLGWGKTRRPQGRRGCGAREPLIKSRKLRGVWRA